MMDIFETIRDKKRKYKFYKNISLFLLIFLTFIGSILIIYLSMFLYEINFLSYFGCFVLDLVFGSFYSLFVNFVSDKINCEKNKLLCEINDLERSLNKALDDKNNERELRYDSLSRDSKLKLLNGIKDSLCEYNLDNSDSFLENDSIVNDLECNNLDINNNSESITIYDDDRDLVDGNDRGYSRKRKK